jgi:hypothetical protein
MSLKTGAFMLTAVFIWVAAFLTLDAFHANTFMFYIVGMALGAFYHAVFRP